ncbi:MAG: hypothetical protein EPN89_02010 [Methylovulum sp.]|nr:MAG: hypothetical protein EPN89_02010 [Methylovulum sp.]
MGKKWHVNIGDLPGAREEGVHFHMVTVDLQTGDVVNDGGCGLAPYEMQILRDAVDRKVRKALKKSDKSESGGSGKEKKQSDGGWGVITGKGDWFSTRARR